MDRIIEMKVNGNYLRKDSGYAGVQHEANAKRLRLIFDEDWDGFAKTVTFWNALGKNPVKRALTADLLENMEADARIYLCPIPKEAMAEAGKLELVIDGYADGRRQRSVSEKLRVDPAPCADDANDPTDPTPTQAEQLQAQIDTLLQDIRTESTKATSSAAQAANSEIVAVASASSAALSASGAAASAQAASESRAAAEKAAAVAASVAGGDYASIQYVDGEVDAAKKYADAKIAAIPTPDVSGQIGAHNTNANAHSDIRSLIANAQATAQSAASTKVAKSGDTMTGALRVEISNQRNIVSVNPNNNMAYMQYADLEKNVAANLGLNENEIFFQPTLDMKTWTKYPLLHTGNKDKIFAYGTADLVAGESKLATGMLYFVYE